MMDKGMNKLVDKVIRTSQKQRGFTLIELMLVLAIVAALAAFAIPTYQQFVVRSWRVEGRAALQAVQLEQERYMSQTGTYMAFAPGASGTPFKTTSSDNATSSAYNIGARACAGKSLRECVEVYTAAANGKSDPKTGVLALTSAGVKSCTGTDETLCWP